MKKAIAYFLIPSLFLGLINPSIANSAVAKKGATCTSLGKVVSLQDVSLVCGKVGKKKIWIETSSDSSSNSEPSPSPSTNACPRMRGQILQANYGATAENMLIIGFDNPSSCNLNIDIRGSFLISQNNIQMSCPVSASWSLSPNERMRMDFAGYSGLRFNRVIGNLSSCPNWLRPQRDFVAVVTSAN